MSKTSKTDWARIDAMTDEEIDYSDIPPITAEMYAKSFGRLPRIQPLWLHLQQNRSEAGHQINTEPVPSLQNAITVHLYDAPYDKNRMRLPSNRTMPSTNFTGFHSQQNAVRRCIIKTSYILA